MKFLLSCLRGLQRLFSGTRQSIPCCIKGCGAPAVHAAGIRTMVMSVGGASSVSGRIRPLCDSQHCLDIMKRVEKTDAITLTPIHCSIYAPMLRAA